MILYSIIYEISADTLLPAQQEEVLASSIEVAVELCKKKHPDAQIKCVSVGDKTLMYEEANELNKIKST